MDGSANAHLWPFLGRLAEEFPGGWVLVGGQMVLLLGLEQGELPQRETDDADALVRVKVLPAGTSQLSAFLEDQGVMLDGVSPGGIGHRFRGEGLTVDVLAPDNIGTRADLTTIRPARTVEVPGGTRLLSSPRRCPVRVAEQVFAIPRPDLPAAIVGKAAALSLPDPSRHAQDLAFLLGLVDDVRTLAAGLTPSDNRWLSHTRQLLENERVWNYSHRPQAARAALLFLLGA